MPNETSRVGGEHLQVAVEPKALVVYSRMNGDCKLIVQDSSSLCAEDEQLSYATLQVRAQAVDQVRSTVNPTPPTRRLAVLPLLWH